MEAAAVALNVTVVAPAAIVTVAGTLSKVLLLASVTLDPPVGALCVKVMVHVLVAPEFNVVGEQVTVERDGTVTVPPPPDTTLTPSPLESVPIGFDIRIEAVVVPGATVALR
jgi:hypothetical protein